MKDTELYIGQVTGRACPLECTDTSRSVGCASLRTEKQRRGVQMGKRNTCTAPNVELAERHAKSAMYADIFPKETLCVTMEEAIACHNLLERAKSE